MVRSISRGTRIAGSRRARWDALRPLASTPARISVPVGRRGCHNKRCGIAKQVRMLRDHGQAKKYYHEMEGYNGRLDSIQAGILRVKLAHLERWNSERRERAATYNSLLANNPALQLPHEPSWSRAVYHLYVVRTADRDAMIQYLNTAKIGTGIHYPIPLHLQKAYSSLNYAAGDFPVSERLQRKSLASDVSSYL